MKTKSSQILKTFIATTVLATVGIASLSARAAETATIKGEVVDLMCYLDHGAKGDKHADCAKTCIRSGGQVGILTSDDQLYLIVGDHKPINDKLVDMAAKTVTVKGKVVERNGMKMIENAEIEK